VTELPSADRVCFLWHRSWIFLCNLDHWCSDFTKI